MKTLRNVVVAGVVLGAYSLLEAKAFRLVERHVPTRPGVPPLTILHISDTHLTGGSRALIRFLDGLPEKLGATPDLVLATGDFIENDSGIEPLIEAFGRLDARFGRFYVLGSHDYFQSSLKGFAQIAKIFLGLERDKFLARPAETGRLTEGLDAKGWISLSNRTECIEVPGGRIRIAGVDDPYIKRHTTEHAHRAPDDDLALALMHSPDVVSEWTLAGYDLVLAGHTHFGQVRIPPVGTVVTNCSIPSGLAGGLNRVGAAWLHVSPGLGTGTFAPIRFLARPEVTLLHLSPEFA